MMNFFKRFALTWLILIGLNFNSLAQTCDSYKNTLASDKEYRITFGDSGVGGLIFALDVAEELEKKLKKLETEYGVKFIFDHFGDSKNAPYGSKTPSQIKTLTKNFLSYQLALPNTKTSVIACNTASTVFDEKMKNSFKEKYPDIEIITMIEDSSLAILQAANDKNKDDKNHIALLATPATIKSQSYQNKINELGKNDDFALYSYAPQNWVKNVETGASKEIANAELEKDLEIFKNSIGQNFTKVETVGLFCTHYPFYKKEIKNFFMKNGNKNATILTQGHIFSQKIYTDILRNLASEKNSYAKRTKKIPYKCTNNIKINSTLTGDNIEQTRNVIQNTHPSYVERISFKKVVLE